MDRIERVADPGAHTGEGAQWHPAERRLYWADIPAGVLYRYDPETSENTVAYETNGTPVGGYTVESDGACFCSLTVRSNASCRGSPRPRPSSGSMRTHGSTT